MPISATQACDPGLIHFRAIPFVICCGEANHSGCSVKSLLNQCLCEAGDSLFVGFRSRAGNGSGASPGSLCNEVKYQLALMRREVAEYMNSYVHKDVCHVEGAELYEFSWHVGSV